MKLIKANANNEILQKLLNAKAKINNLSLRFSKDLSFIGKDIDCVEEVSKQVRDDFK